MLDAAKLREKLRESGTLKLDISVIPRAPSGEVSEIMSDGTLKLKVTAAPEKGRANDEVCAVLAEFFDVPKRNVQVILGRASRRKRVSINI